MHNNEGSLVIAGSGIKSISHLTTETIAYIKQSQLVLYYLNEPIMEEWVKKNNPNTQSFNFLESKFELRVDLYSAISEFIIEKVKTPLHVCGLFYGHPTVLTKSALNAAKKLRDEKFYVKILPGISAEDCLFADLWIDPGSQGWQSFEATEFLMHNKKIDTSCHLILWQIGFLGCMGSLKKINNTYNMAVLSSYLKKLYSDDHEVILYEAALYPHRDPKITPFLLKDLTEVKTTPLSTLYIPPTSQFKNQINNPEKINLYS